MGVGFRTWPSSTLDIPLHDPPPVGPDVMQLISQSTHVLPRPEIIRMSELNDSSELQTYSSAVLYVLSAVTPPPEYIEVIADNFINAIQSSTVRIRSYRWERLEAGD